jgi:CheY-like chemotaxis protein
MTAAALTEDRDHCRAAGMDGYVIKPATIEALEETLGVHVLERDQPAHRHARL